MIYFLPIQHGAFNRLLTYIVLLYMYIFNCPLGQKYVVQLNPSPRNRKNLDLCEAIREAAHTGSKCSTKKIYKYRACTSLRIRTTTTSFQQRHSSSRLQKLQLTEQSPSFLIHISLVPFWITLVFLMEIQSPRSPIQPPTFGNLITILSIDGGGIRGIIPATILAFLESELQVVSIDLVCIMLLQHKHTCILSMVSCIIT